MPAKSGTMVQEHTAKSVPATADAGYDMYFGVFRPRKRVIDSFGKSADMAPATKNAGNRHNNTCAAR
jgi:hypothetical protein